MTLLSDWGGDRVFFSQRCLNLRSGWYLEKPEKHLETRTGREARGGARDTGSWLHLSTWWLRLQDKGKREPAQPRVRPDYQPAAIWV